MPTPFSLPRLASSFLLLLLVACSSLDAPRLFPTGPPERGEASWYGPRFHGRKTASGERYNMHALTAAHRTLPFGTRVRVRNLENGESVEVRINDRGPFARGRIVDLSYAAAKALGLVGPGTAQVELSIIGPVPPPGAEYHAVQVGAFSELERASSLRDRLIAEGLAAEVRSDATWHRVQIGRFERLADAETLRDELARLGWTALVVAVP
ncbi:MAG: septal ring lytic transglycosylase RlpA family protein [Thermoanaerobaculia bacterium]|nr:septal ring lytic transglycosylase RlpA family protein [Thermoanaerobaculia bacterium]